MRALLLSLLFSSLACAANAALPGGALPHGTAAPLAYRAPANHRVRKSINREWTFRYFPGQDADRAGYEAPSFDDSAWSAVAIPHTWSTYETTRELHPFIRNAGEKNSTKWWFGWGWYRKHFSIDRSQSRRKVFAEFDAVQKYCKVWLNGKYLGDHKGGFHSFYFDLTDAVRFGQDNVLVLAVNNRQTDAFHIPPMDAGNWDLYGGIYRDVRLVITDRLYVPFQGSYRHEGGTFITTPKVSEEASELRVRTWVRNDGKEPRSCELRSVVVDARGGVVGTLSTKKTIQPGELAEFDQHGDIARPHLWSIESPYVYELYSELREAGSVVDLFKSSFGIRTFRWDLKTDIFYVNEKPVNLHGFIQHQEYPWLGDAMPSWLREADLRDMKDNLGANIFRSGHYTTDASVYDFCDRRGLVVAEDVPNVKDKEFSREVQEQQVREMVRRDRNHPSIFVWSMGDESNRAADSKWAHEEDPTRYVHARDCAPPATGDFISLSSEHLRLGRLLRCTIRGWYSTDDKAFEPTNQQSAGNEEWQHTIFTRPEPPSSRVDQRNLVVWIYADHGCYRSYRNEPLLNINPKGWVDQYRFPKYAYYLFQANYAVKPMVFIHPHFWRSRYAGQKKDFVVDSNCDSVELKVNGRSFGVLKPSEATMHVVTFKDVPVERGVLTAIGVKDGETTTHSVTMAGEPARIVLTASHAKLEAARDSVAIIKADIVDAHGAHVYGATNTVHWSVEGPATLVGPAVYETDIDKNAELDGAGYIDMPVANVVRSTGKPGVVKVRVQAAGLAFAELSLIFKEAAAPAPGPIVQPAVAEREPAAVTQKLSQDGAGLRLTAESEEGYARQLREWLPRTNQGMLSGTPEFDALVKVLSQQLTGNGGTVDSRDFAFNAANYERCRRITTMLDRSPLPARFKEELRSFYAAQVIEAGNERPFEREKAWISALPTNGALVTPKAGEDLKATLARVHPESRDLDAARQERALARLSEINPFIRRSRWVDGNIRKGPWEFMTSYTVAPGCAILVPEMEFLLQ